jgi:hypothetical protein
MMPEVEVDVANVRTVRGELAPAAPSGRRDSPERPDPAPTRPVLVAAALISLAWLALCGLYVFHMQTSTVLASVSVEQAVLYSMAVLLPLLAVWLVSINLIQARELRFTSRLINDSLVGMTYPSDEAQERVAWAVRNLKSQADQLRHATELARDRSEMMERMLRRQTDTLFEASDAVEKSTGQAGAALEAQNAGLTASLASLGSRAAEIEASIEAATAKLDAATEQSLERTRSAQAALANRADDLLTASERAAKRTEGISETYAGIIGHMDEATARAAAQIDEINRGYAAQAKAMMAAGDSLAERMREITEATRREVIAIEEAGERSRFRAEKMEETVAAHGKRLNELAEETQHWLRETADHFSLQAEFMKDLSRDAVQGLHNGIGDAVSRVDDAGRRFVALTASLEEQTVATSSRIGQSAEQMGQQAALAGQAWDKAASDAAEQAGRSAAAFAARTAELAQAADAAAQGIAQAAGGMSRSLNTDTEGMVGTVEAAFARTESLKSAFEELSGRLDTVSGAAARSLEEGGRQVNSQIERLDHAADRAASRSREMSEQFAAQNDSFASSVGRSENALSAYRAQTEATAAHIREIAAEMDQRGKAMEERLAGRTANMKSILESAAEEAARVEQGLAAAAQGLVQATEGVGGKARESGLRILHEIQSLRSAMGDAAGKISAAARTAASDTRTAVEASDGAVRRLEKLQQALEAHDAEARRVSHRAFERVLGVGEMLETISQKLTTVADEASTHLGRSTEEFSAQAEAARQTAADAATRLEATGQLLDANGLRLADYARQSEEFRVRADSLIHAARELAGAAARASGSMTETDEAFRQRADRLLDMAESLGHRLSAMEQLERQATGAAFSRTANNILESLGSLAIDVDRLLEAEIPQKVWQQYKAGDSQAFARHLARQGSAEWDALIAERFQTSGEFRDYVSRYLNQFEGLLQQAMKNERTDALAASLLSSDMGKLYVVLAKAVNRLH